MTPERWKEVKKYLAAALERKPGERSAYLDQACPEPSLRQEVESLIAAHEQGNSSFLKTAAVESEVLKSGTKLGWYEIVAPIGSGGMGQVYRAMDTRLKRTVAIKVAKENFGERFEHEARAIAALNHPNICTLYDVGPNYLVMELIEGQPLKGPLPLDRALQYAAQICDALDAAHRKRSPIGI